eukprot:CAMPEP_0114285990 /NCGR_PEP_ID=MMETSP0059-20121206/5509_1 /TAXON_ID=36894 /ORGANISM="Pyramimonas parkeae, Strain CCMP726" /LENGTH=83 /DNA_ID=CAMNT_0001406981 /DNA_START=526 /DNA_END=775 /DNA_ORIENTATION=-
MKLDATKYAVLEKEARLQVLEAERDACGDRRLIRVNQGPQHKYIHRNCQGDMKPGEMFTFHTLHATVKVLLNAYEGVISNART